MARLIDTEFVTRYAPVNFDAIISLYGLRTTLIRCYTSRFVRHDLENRYIADDSRHATTMCWSCSAPPKIRKVPIA